MTFQVPTYKEYMTATAYAKFKYKYGIIVMILCWACLLFIVYYMYTNGEAIASNPFTYGAKKMGVECFCYKPGASVMDRMEFYFNATTLWTSNT